jgi:NAD(P)-dependent dehydrogenase (short-subunit alcohol dehydrogenase family)
MNYTLEGRAAIITGASQGLGQAIAQAYVDAGQMSYYVLAMVRFWSRREQNCRSAP